MHPPLHSLQYFHSSPFLALPLQDKQDNITSQACQDEVFYYELMEVSDFRNDVILAEACRNDVEAYCKDTEPGAWGGQRGRGAEGRRSLRLLGMEGGRTFPCAAAP